MGLMSLFRSGAKKGGGALVGEWSAWEGLRRSAWAPRHLTWPAPVPSDEVLASWVQKKGSGRKCVITMGYNQVSGLDQDEQTFHFTELEFDSRLSTSILPTYLRYENGQLQEQEISF